MLFQVEAVYAGGHAKVVFDDGDVHVLPADTAHILPPDHPAFDQKVPTAAPTKDGLPEETTPLRA